MYSKSDGLVFRVHFPRFPDFTIRLHKSVTTVLINMSTIPQVHRFNVGGKRYEVSQSMLDQHPQTMLARLASEAWNQGGKAEEIFIERDGERFRFVLDFLRDGKVGLPLSADTKATFVAELDYFGVDYGDASSIQHLTECPGLTALVEDHLDRLRDALGKAADEAYERKDANIAEGRTIDAEIMSIAFARFCITAHLTKPYELRHFDTFSKEFVTAVTVEQASTALGPFGFRCVLLNKYDDFSGFRDVKIEALIDAPCLPPVTSRASPLPTTNGWCTIL